MGIFFPILRYGFFLQIIAIVHFIRRRPDGFWLWIIIFGGGLGALVYIAAEVIPDLGLLRGTFRAFPRRQRIHELQAMVRDNPSAGNYEELGGLYLDNGDYARARECFDRAISARTDSPDPFYRRALAEPQPPTWRRSQRKTRTTISIAPPDCWRTATGRPATSPKPTPCSRA
jgi:tetratricopeptide (TPR) repeat protein